jgi:lipid A disaccharide synthetase
VALRRAAVRHVALPNLVLRREALPELVFDAATPAALAQRLATLLADARVAEAQRDAAAEFLEAVAPIAASEGAASPQRPSQVAAEAVLRRVGEHLAAAGA